MDQTHPSRRSWTSSSEVLLSEMFELALLVGKWSYLLCAEGANYGPVNHVMYAAQPNWKLVKNHPRGPIHTLCNNILASLWGQSAWFVLPPTSQQEDNHIYHVKDAVEASKGRRSILRTGVGSSEQEGQQLGMLNKCIGLLLCYTFLQDSYWPSPSAEEKWTDPTAPLESLRQQFRPTPQMNSPAHCSLTNVCKHWNKLSSKTVDPTFIL